MTIEQYVEEARVRNHLLEPKTSMEKWIKSPEDTAPDDNSTAGFDCNICLDSVHDPVVTLCGHIYCWPCIYKWLQFQSNENQVHKQKQCPVCKAEVSNSTLVPLYGPGRTSRASIGKAGQLGIVIPKRPLGPDFGSLNTSSSPQLAYQMQPQVHGYPSSPMDVPDPATRMFSEVVYTRVFGDPDSYNLVRSTSPRIRRHIMQAEKSLDRLSFFLLCCLLTCLLLF